MLSIEDIKLRDHSLPELFWKWNLILLTSLPSCHTALCFLLVISGININRNSIESNYAMPTKIAKINQSN